jgi:peptide/nickel transport system substrate-binding protein
MFVRVANRTFRGRLIRSGLISALLLAGLSLGCSKKEDTGKKPEAEKTAKKGADKAPAAVNKKSITIGISQEPDSLFMPFKEMMASEEVARTNPYTLTIFDEDWSLIPWAAKEIPTLENGKLELFEEGGVQKMRTTWEIRDEFYWADGKPLTADDFVFSHELILDPDQEVIDRTVDEKIESMEAKGENRKTLVVKWKEPYAYYHNYRQHTCVPKHIIEPIYRANPKELKKHPFGQKPILAGSYTIKEWVPGSHIIANKNPHAKGFLVPTLDEIIWRIIPKTNTLEANLVSGTVDAISPLGLTLDQALLFEKRHKEKFDFHYAEGLVWEHIDFNMDNEILKDVRVRQALAHAADRAGISKQMFEGKQPVAHATEPPRSPYYNPDVRKYDYSPEKAGALLDEAGWKVGKKGIREKDGKPLKLTIMTTSGNKTREQVEVLLQSQWRKVGIEIEIKNQPAKVFFGETLRHRKYDHMAMYAWTKDPVSLSDTLWRCDYIPSKKNSFQGQNQPGWCNQEAHDLLVAGSKELDDKKRAEIGKKFEAIWAEELPALPLFFRVNASVTKKGLKNWKPTGTLQAVTWNAHKWGWGEAQ